jgi:hypothetical protein
MNLEVSSFANVPQAYANDLLAHGTLRHGGQVLHIDNAIYAALRVKHGRSAPTRLVTALTNWVAKGMAFTPSEELTKRQETCKSCEHFTGSRCKLCGCFTEAKQRMATEKCPIGKW